MTKIFIPYFYVEGDIVAILVAGGAGYIGSHVCKMLKERGYDVIILDNLSHGHRSFAKYGEFILGDIADENLLDLIFTNYNIEAVMHFCAYIEVGESVKDPNKYYKNNVSNTITLLNAMLKHNVKYFVFHQPLQYMACQNVSL